MIIHDFFLSYFKDDNYGAEEVENLKSLVSNLRQLLDLHRKYNCRLSLSVFEKVLLLLVTYSEYKLYEESLKTKVCNHVGTQVMLTLSMPVDVIDELERLDCFMLFF